MLDAGQEDSNIWKLQMKWMYF